MKTETVDISTLTCDSGNTRKHSERNLKTIQRSLEAFGQQKPIVVNSEGVVVAGNGTLEAARAMGDDPCCCGVADLEGWRVNRANLNHARPDSAPAYTVQMKVPGTAQAFKACAQDGLGWCALRKMSYEQAMEVARRSRGAWEVMGVRLPGGKRAELAETANG